MRCIAPPSPHVCVRLASTHTCAAPCIKPPRSCCFRAGPLQSRQRRPASAPRAAAEQPNAWLPLSGALWLLGEAAARADQGADFSKGGFAKESYYVTLGLFLLSLPGAPGPAACTCLQAPPPLHGARQGQQRAPWPNVDSVARRAQACGRRSSAHQRRSRCARCTRWTAPRGRAPWPWTTARASCSSTSKSTTMRSKRRARP